MSLRDPEADALRVCACHRAAAQPCLYHEHDYLRARMVAGIATEEEQRLLRRLERYMHDFEQSAARLQAEMSRRRAACVR